MKAAKHQIELPQRTRVHVTFTARIDVQLGRAEHRQTLLLKALIYPAISSACFSSCSSLMPPAIFSPLVWSVMAMYSYRGPPLLPPSLRRRHRRHSMSCASANHLEPNTTTRASSRTRLSLLLQLGTDGGSRAAPAGSEDDRTSAGVEFSMYGPTPCSSINERPWFSRSAASAAT